MLSTIREQWFSNIRELCTRQISQNPYLSGFCLLKIAKISLNSSFSQNQLNAESPFEHSLNHSEINSLRVVMLLYFYRFF